MRDTTKLGGPPSQEGEPPTSEKRRWRLRGQSVVEFALVLPVLLVLAIGVADFGQVFAAGITVEAAARDGAEAAAQEYLHNGPGYPAPRQLTSPAPIPGDPDYNGDPCTGGNMPPACGYYTALHDLAARTACRESRLLVNTTFSADTCPSTPASSQPKGCPARLNQGDPPMTDCGFPVIEVCVHDGVDPLCGGTAWGVPLPPDHQCSALEAPISNAMADVDPQNPQPNEVSRYVEVRMCYRFTSMAHLSLPWGWGLGLGDTYLQKTRVFTVGFYPPLPTPSPPPPPTPPPSQPAPTDTPSPTPTPTPGPSTPAPTPTPTPCAGPTASFTVSTSPPNGKAPQTATFSNLSTAPASCPITIYFWAFGDGTTSALQNPPQKVYSTAGTYTITLTVTNASGSNSTSKSITVKP
jgi:hypothetical protein